MTGGYLAAWAGSGPYPTLTLDFEAEERGTDSSTRVGGIVAEAALAPAGVLFVANTAALLGQDDESDESLRERCRKSTGPLSPGGVRSAYEYVALATRIPDGTWRGAGRTR